MDRSPDAEIGVLPGTAVLILCAVILCAGYAAVINRLVGRNTPVSKVSPAVPVIETAETR